MSNKEWHCEQRNKTYCWLNLKMDTSENQNTSTTIKNKKCIV